jgi:hypothetical protein
MRLELQMSVYAHGLRSDRHSWFRACVAVQVRFCVKVIADTHLFICNIHTYIHIYIHTYIPTYLHTYIPTHTYMHRSKHICIYNTRQINRTPNVLAGLATQPLDTIQFNHCLMHALTPELCIIYCERRNFIFIICFYFCVITYIYTYIHTYVHTYIHTYIHTYMCVQDDLKKEMKRNRERMEEQRIRALALKRLGRISPYYPLTGTAERFMVKPLDEADDIASSVVDGRQTTTSLISDIKRKLAEVRGMNECGVIGGLCWGRNE